MGCTCKLHIAPRTGFPKTMIRYPVSGKPSKNKDQAMCNFWHVLCSVEHRAVLQSTVHAFSSEPLSGPSGPPFFAKVEFASCR
jgi:hypothetical protein